MHSHPKVTADHLRRQACVYVRQSSLRQVLVNTESAHRQYDLRTRAKALGWPMDNIAVIDDDQGLSGATSSERTGFRDLLGRVAAREVGLILSLEAYRLSRNNADWHHLLDIARVTNTLLADEHGVYDPNHAEDRLMLGLKGTLSEYELHGIRTRMIGGQHSKARRGELKLPLPVGLVYDASDKVRLDPDEEITKAIELVFAMFRTKGSVMQVTRWFHKQGIHLPSRTRLGGKLYWALPNHGRIAKIIRNPRYAGCYVYGRTGRITRPDGRTVLGVKPMDQWQVCIPNAHEGFIDWEEYLRNVDTLRSNKANFMPGKARQRTPGTGPALLQSKILCGKCGNRMFVTYHHTQGCTWYYVCKERCIRYGAKLCQSMWGIGLDAAVSDFLIAAVNREKLALALAIRDRLRADFKLADHHRTLRIEALAHKVECAKERYMAVDPRNRLVATALEADWNDCLRELNEATAKQAHHRTVQARVTNQDLDKKILALASNFKKVWNAPAIEPVERKRMLGLLIEDITLTREGRQVKLDLRLRGGKCVTLPPVAMPTPRAELIRRDLSKAALDSLDKLLDDGHSDASAAEELNRQGHRDSHGDPITKTRVNSVRQRYQIPSVVTRQRAKLRSEGYKRALELAAELGISDSTVRLRAKTNSGIERKQVRIGKHKLGMYRMLTES